MRMRKLAGSARHSHESRPSKHLAKLHPSSFIFHPFKSAFTLVELMVVSAILVVLISLLLPSLTAAKEKAKQMVCLNNMRQLGTATQNYLADNNFTLMNAWDSRYNYGSGQYFMLAPYLNLESKVSAFAYRQWSHSSNVYWCPSAREDERTIFRMDHTEWNYAISSYGYNRNHAYDGEAGRSITKYLGKESTMVVFYEWRMFQYYDGGSTPYEPYLYGPTFNGPTWAQWVITRPAHNRSPGLPGCNYFLFLDGHVEGIPTRSTWSDYMTPTMQWGWNY